MGWPKGKPRRLTSETVEAEDVMGVVPDTDPDEDAQEEVEVDLPEPQEDETRPLRLPTRTASRPKPKKPDYWNDRAAAESGHVKKTLDLSQFLVFDAKTAGDGKDKFITVGIRGIAIAKEISKELPEGAKVELLLNRCGTILVMRTSDNGIPVQPGRSQGGTVSCGALRRVLENLGIQLPAKFSTEWDPAMNVWVGRREEQDEQDRDEEKGA